MFNNQIKIQVALKRILPFPLVACTLPSRPRKVLRHLLLFARACGGASIIRLPLYSMPKSARARNLEPRMVAPVRYYKMSLFCLALKFDRFGNRFTPRPRMSRQRSW